MSERLSFPVVYVDATVLYGQVRFIRNVLRSLRVHDDDLGDVTQDVLFGAWRAMTAGRFRVRPGTPIDDALRSWLFGIAWRQVTHYHDRAHRRREVLSGRLEGVTLVARSNPESEAAARLQLDLVVHLPPPLRSVIVLAAEEITNIEIGERLGISVTTVTLRLRLARAQLLELLSAKVEEG
ncbi:MAG: sigma-70 family RNA polymerase sigma factor [Polyangiaceae bacterium]|nr:sigma-70 family RNA polymerase sigma factor [Polyangiaceae bacterium]